MHNFGGNHTEQKLELLSAYLQSYTIALKRQKFKLLYLDAFAGTGSRIVKKDTAPLFGRNEDENDTLSLPGSAQLALEIEPAFDSYHFVETNKSFYSALEKLQSENPKKSIKLYDLDANEVIQQICEQTDWRTGRSNDWGTRAVFFLDPYGMEVEWSSLQKIAKTKSIDIWYLFSLEGLYRNMPHDKGSISDDKRSAINKMLGTNEWETALYQVNELEDLFGSTSEETARADIQKLEKYVCDRLNQIFPYVSQPKRIANHKNIPKFSLFFATANPNNKAYGLAKKLSEHILRPK